jgi:TPR repeat protein
LPSAQPALHLATISLAALAFFYATGEAGERDNVSAHLWFNLAAAHFAAWDPAAVRRDAARCLQWRANRKVGGQCPNRRS